MFKLRVGRVPSSQVLGTDYSNNRWLGQCKVYLHYPLCGGKNVFTEWGELIKGGGALCQNKL